MQTVAAAGCNCSHESVLRSAAALPRSPPGTHDVGGLAINTVRSVHPELSVDHLVGASRAHMGVELSDFRSDVPADQKVRRDGIPGGVAGFEDRIELAVGQRAIRAEGP